MQVSVCLCQSFQKGAKGNSTIDFVVCWDARHLIYDLLFLPISTIESRVS